MAASIPANETPEELEFKRKRLLSQGPAAGLRRAALKLGDADRARSKVKAAAAWRFKLATCKCAWTIWCAGPQQYDEASQSDPGLVRADSSYLYSFTSVGRRHRVRHHAYHPR